MRIGCIGYAVERGLGHLARDFYAKGLITDFLVVNHPSIPSKAREWYPGARQESLRQLSAARVIPPRVAEYVLNLDALICFETPFCWDVFYFCRKVGVKTFLVTMYECTPINHVRPDVYLCPSLLDCQYFFKDAGEAIINPFLVCEGAGESGAAWVRLPVEYPWRRRERAEHFVHNGGYLGVRARGGIQREGTETVIRALPLVKSPIRLTVRVQENVSPELQQILARDRRAEYVAETVPYEDLYATGDVAVGAQRWNGCSLPLQEQLASGMLVMNTNRFPVNTWLPNEPLVPVTRVIRDSRIGGPYMTFDESHVDPEWLARRVDEWYGKDIASYSEWGQGWAERNSWGALLPRWREVLES